MSVCFLTDENFDGDILAGLRRQVERLDIVRVQDVGLRTADDPTILARAADESRVLVTHDLRTIPDVAYERVAAGQAMPGAFIVRKALPMAAAIAELAAVAGASEADEWHNQVVYLPLR